ncbi:ParB/Sulfiredoxin [uncultured Caudovirales phage]|uniref:ParB/Sulfiredoxin n=1 Tax=uncultured Caudovirales phage TaxID=2100421 RepID=A0A6J5S0Q3_9CAUD|nr:ParB/Sulfiredoxin [uncultured Caudovirales phage]
MTKDDGVEEPVKASEVEVEAPEVDGLTDAERIAALGKFADGYVRVPVGLLRPAKRNARRGAVAEVVESLREFGQHRPVVVQRSTGEVIVGNHLLKAAKMLGWAEIDALIVEDDDKQALRRGIADNAVGDKAGWDKDELAELLDEVGVVPGFDDREVQELLSRLEAEAEQPEPMYPIVARMNEQYDYVVIVAQNATDVAWLETNLELRNEKSYKATQTAKSHVLSVERFQELIGK